MTEEREAPSSAEFPPPKNDESCTDAPISIMLDWCGASADDASSGEAIVEVLSLKFLSHRLDNRRFLWPAKGAHESPC